MELPGRRGRPACREYAFIVTGSNSGSQRCRRDYRTQSGGGVLYRRLRLAGYGGRKPLVGARRALHAGLGTLCARVLGELGLLARLSDAAIDARDAAAAECGEQACPNDERLARNLRFYQTK